MTVSLDNGTAITYNPPAGGDLQTAIKRLDEGHAMLRKWLQDQLPPSQRPVETRRDVRSGTVRITPTRESVERALQSDPTDLF